MRKLSLYITILLPLAQALALDVVKDQSTVKISSGGKPCIEYRFNDVPFKPYAAQLYTPSGIAMLRDSPSDHKHHHSLMFALAADGNDFWSEVPRCGKQSHKQIETDENGLTQQIEWISSEGKQVLTEERKIRVHQEKNMPATLLTWKSKLQAPAGRDEVKLTGSHYFGLGVRFVSGMDKIGTFLNSSGQTGEVVRGTERLVTAKWCACSGPAAEGKMVTVAIFDHPSNLRHPARMFTMSDPFSYISSTLNLWKEPYILKSGQPLNLKYGVAAWDGKIDAVQIEELYQQWLKLAE